ncbi:MAG: hypothetical protein K2I96_18615 [Lachnospiraceae bacterium]|nr:hypothetical protein [Lachnospiraceae bacterium]
MVKTFDFIFAAHRDESFMKQLKEAVSSDVDVEICTDIMRLHFDSKNKVVIVRPFSETSAFHCKVVPAEITYHALLKMLANEWEGIDYHNGIEWL